MTGHKNGQEEGMDFPNFLKLYLNNFESELGDVDGIAIPGVRICMEKIALLAFKCGRKEGIVEITNLMADKVQSLLAEEENK